MGRTTRRRPTGARRASFAAVALMLGGGGLVAANVYASATEGGDGANVTRQADGAGGATTVECPDVGARLTDVPESARARVDQELAAMDAQIAEAYQRMSGDGSDDVMAGLKQKRAESLGRIGDAIDEAGKRPEGLDDLAACSWSEPEEQTKDGGQEQGQGQEQGSGQEQGQGQEPAGEQPGGQGGNGPVAADYAAIDSVQPNAPAPDLNSFRSKGSFTTACGVNENGLFNSDNVIVAPGVSNGAHHFHDYVGNQSNTAFASDDDLSGADTSCVDKGDKSSYFWPVLRLQNGTQERDAGAPGGGTEGNAGQIVTAKQATMTFIGNPRSEVTAIPRLMRIITGDAKAFVNGPGNANASWSCTGFEDRQLKDKYPLCPQGSDVVRTFRFQSCWDGRNTDSANHRTHVAFADAAGNCPDSFVAIPQLVQRIVYDVDAPSLADGGRTTPLFAVDSFPEQLHKPVTDHGDFINVFDAKLMDEVVACINDGKQCGAGTGGGDNGNGNGGGDNGNGGNGGNGGAGEEPSQQPTEQPTQEPTGNPGGGKGDNAGNGGGQNGGQNGGGKGGKGEGGGQEQSAAPTASAPADDQQGGGSADGSATEEPKEPKVLASASAEPSRAAGAADTASSGGGDQAQQQPQGEPTGEGVPIAGGQSEPQAVQGDLAETGTTLWPAAVGTVLLIGGLVLLTRTRRQYGR